MSNHVILGLSGGVDSAVAAHLLLSQGDRVTAVFLNNGTPHAAVEEAAACAVSGALGIEFLTVDIRDALERLVCAPFAEEYLRGRTPNPCILCNPAVKFRALCRIADERGAELISTGHYAKVHVHPITGKPMLYDTGSPKDQSYMLSRLSDETIARCVFPIAGRTKEEVRAIAREAGIPVADRPDSMEICFIPDKNYAAFVEARGVCPPAGDFVDENGNVLGRHNGIHHYTVGMRKGLGIALGAPAYVTEVRPDKNQVVLGFSGSEYRSEVRLTDCVRHWEGSLDGMPVMARVRHSRVVSPAVIFERDGEIVLSFDPPVRAPAPGQTAVCYADGFVLLSGFIG